MAIAQKEKAPQKSKIFLVDDHPIVLEGLIQLLEQEEDLTVCGQADTVHKTREEVARLKPDLVVVDISLKEINGLELIKALALQHPDLPIMVLSMHDESVYAERAIRAGARGYVMKDQGTEILLAAIRKILRGQIHLSERMTTVLLRQIAQAPAGRQISALHRLTDRELEILDMIGRGMKSRQIAKTLHLSVKTIGSYREHIKQKLGLANATQLVQYASRWVEASSSSRPN